MVTQVIKIDKKLLNPRTRKMLARAIKDIKNGKNMSPAFNNAKDAIAYLKGL